MGEAQKFITELCKVYGLNYLHAVRFEHRVKKADRKGINRIDGFFPGLLMVEMKSAGEDLQAAFEQALNYVQLLDKEDDKPQHILVSDFQNLHLYALNADKTDVLPEQTVRFKLANFIDHVEDMAFICGYEARIADRNEALTLAAANKLADLHQAFLASGYPNNAELQTTLVRILFCLFADDTDLFSEENAFENLIHESKADGSDTGERLKKLFDWLDTNEEARAKTPAPIQNQYNGFRSHFPYINGKLFRGSAIEIVFTPEMREALLECCQINWGDISPDIFGTLFQNIMELSDTPANQKTAKKSAQRRELGAHYTSEKNIRRAIEPLFINELKEEYQAAVGDKTKLEKLIVKLQSLQILDPACGCGNFLIVAYREMRLLEMQALHELAHTQGGNAQLSQCDVHQFHGFEIDNAACEIATVAMWLTDHQMNRLYQDGYKRIPLNHKANIHCLNALQHEWHEVLPQPEKISYIVGNPPFLGKTYQSAQQKQDMAKVAGHFKNHASLDYVAAWYIKAADFMKRHPHTRTAFVSTNSITQGEQVAVLWQPLVSDGLNIRFAHRTFKWNNEGRGMAAVHCVIIGFDRQPWKRGERGTIWDYADNISGSGIATRVKKINPYLVEAENILVEKRMKQISGQPEIVNGGKPTDGGYLLLSQAEKDELLASEPRAGKYIRQFSMGDEFINNIPRYCLWFADENWEDLQTALKEMPLLAARIEGVRAMREQSTKVATQKLAQTPHLFGEVRTSKNAYLAIPKVSSENRTFIPIGFLDEQTICGDKLFFLPNAKLYHFGILCSTMHNAFMRTVAGRLKSDYSYSNTIVYNNFPFPAELSDGLKQEIEAAAQAVLDARVEHKAHIARLNQAHAGEKGYPLPEPSLATLYNPDTMPTALKQAHEALDDIIDEAYGYTGDTNSDSQRVAFLFEQYQKLLEQEAASKAAVAGAKKKA